MRYSHDRRLLDRGAVNGVPLICSVDRLYAQRCGELRPPDSARQRLGLEPVAEAGHVLRSIGHRFAPAGKPRGSPLPS